MCNFLSFNIVLGEPWKIAAAPSLRHHEEIPSMTPGEYREAEWTDESPDSLIVRTEPGEEITEAQYRAWVLSQWHTRSDMLKYLLTRLDFSQNSLDLSDTQITSLPDNLTVGGSLYLRNTQIASLPDNLTVGGLLDLSNTQITSLPDNLTVGGWLYLRGTQITDIPERLRDKVIR